MQRRHYQQVRHVNAGPNEWVRVHRRHAPASPPPAPAPTPVPPKATWLQIAFKIASWVGAIILALFVLRLLFAAIMWLFVIGMIVSALTIIGRLL